MADQQTPAATVRYNDAPEWLAYIAGLESLISKIAIKYCSGDEALQDDCRQEARIALLTVFPDEVLARLRVPLTTSPAEFIDRFCGRVIRNSILSYLDSYATGNWYVGRTRHVKDKQTGLSRKVRLMPRFSSLATLENEFGMQIDEHKNITWLDPNTDGLVADEETVRAVRYARHGESHRWYPHTPVVEGEGNE